MPLFDFRCNSCSKKFTMMIGVVADSRDPACPACGATDLKKLIGRVSSLRSEDQVLDELSDLERLGDMEDPKQLKKLVREMGKAMDEDMGEDLEEIFEEAMEEEASGASGAGSPDNTIY